jgi:Phage integrase, N-terminal SAM-like domain
MARSSSTGVRVRYGEADEISERAPSTGFSAGYTGSIRVSYTTDLRLFAQWCADAGVRILQVKCAHGELFARHMEANGRMHSTVARRAGAARRRFDAGGGCRVVGAVSWCVGR